MKERTFEIILTRNIPEVFGRNFRLVAQQLSSPSGRIDFLISNGRRNCIVEVKKGRANALAVDQVSRYVDHYASVGEQVEGRIVAHEIPKDIARYAFERGVHVTEVSLARCEHLVANAELDEATLSGVRIEAGIVKGGGAMRFGKNEILFEEALQQMEPHSAALFREIKSIPGIEILSGAMQTIIIYKGVKIGGLRRTNPVYYISSGLVIKQETEAFVIGHGFKRKVKQSKKDHHQHIWYEIKTSHSDAMKTICLDQIARVDRIFKQGIAN